MQDSQLVLSDDGINPAEQVMHSATGNTEPFNALVTKNIIYCTYFDISNNKNIWIQNLYLLIIWFFLQTEHVILPLPILEQFLGTQEDLSLDKYSEALHCKHPNLIDSFIYFSYLFTPIQEHDKP